MRLGTRSLLFGIHQFIWHPIVVLKAWKYLYGKPTWKELVCIIIHDWGYKGKRNLDGEEGIEHPKLGANLASKWFDKDFPRTYWEFCAGHSRSYIKLVNDRWKYEKYSISKLCWADKFSFCFEPEWFYLLRSRLSGEMKEVREVSIANNIITKDESLHIWYMKMFMYNYNLPEVSSIINDKWTEEMRSEKVFNKLNKKKHRIENELLNLSQEDIVVETKVTNEDIRKVLSMFAGKDIDVMLVTQYTSTDVKKKEKTLTMNIDDLLSNNSIDLVNDEFVDIDIIVANYDYPIILIVSKSYKSEV